MGGGLVGGWVVGGWVWWRWRLRVGVVVGWWWVFSWFLTTQGWLKLCVQFHQFRWQNTWESDSRCPRHLALNDRMDGVRKMPHVRGKT